MPDQPCHGTVIITRHLVRGDRIEHADEVIGASTALLEQSGWQPGGSFEVCGLIYDPIGPCPSIPNEVIHMRRRDGR